MKTIAMLLIFFIAMGFKGCENPVVRPGPAYEGSAKWALDIAQPEITSFAGDAVLYQILGAMVWKDGRLPSNTGSWSFVCWSNSLDKILQVTVNHQGTNSTSVRDSPDPPSTGSGGPLPNGWVNSLAIFAAIPAVEVTENFAQLLVVNTTSYPQAPNTALWAINFAGGRNPLVKWDGQYIGTQSD